MKNIAFLILIFTLVGCKSKNVETTNSSDASVYGQKPPGDRPELYQPNFAYINNLNPQSIDLSPDFTEILFSVNDTSSHNIIVYYSNRINDKWAKAEIAYFIPNNGFGYNPKFSPDGKYISYGYNGDIWRATRNGDKWSTAIKMSEPINTEGYECSISYAQSGAIYLAGNGRIEGNKCDIYCLKNPESKADTIRHLDNLSTTCSECMLAVIPNENYLIFTRGFYENGRNGTDLYISFRDKDESWTVAQKLGPYFNGLSTSHSPRFSNDGKYLFYSQGIWNDKLKKYESRQYWISTKYFDDMRDFVLSSDTIKAVI